MAAKSLNCPNCGAAVSSDATRCEHCNSRLATVACPECFGMIFQGAKFCSHCGARVDRREVADAVERLCPRCRIRTRAILIGKSPLRECAKCEGLWADKDVAQQIYADRDRQAAVLGIATPIATTGDAPMETIRYLPCPVCQQLMHRVNFARCSHVVVDVCKPHGTWFDKDELRRIVDFIQAGGLEKAREMEMARLERERHELEAARADGMRDNWSTSRSATYERRGDALTAAIGAVVDAFWD